MRDEISIVTWRREGWEISTDDARFDRAAAHRIISSTYWAEGIPPSVFDCALRNSLNFGLYELLVPAPASRLRGMARVVSDYASYAYVADVCIEAEYRGRGLGEWLMECVRAHPQLQELRRWGLVTRNMQPLYQKSGFQPVEHPEQHMEILRSGLYLQENFEARWLQSRQATP